MHLVCSNKPRPSVQKGAKGNQFWRRDVHHVARDDRRTLCGIDASEWLEMGTLTPAAVNDPNLCGRCRAASALFSSTTHPGDDAATVVTSQHSPRQTGE